MLIRLISLVILLLVLKMPFSFSLEENIFIYPKEKPSIFKNTPIKKTLKKKRSFADSKTNSS